MNQTTAPSSSQPRSARRILAYALIAFFFFVVLLDVWFIVQVGDQRLGGEWGYRGFQLILGIPFGLISTLLILKKPGNALGWMGIITIPLGIISEIGYAYISWAVEHGTRLGIGLETAGFLASWTWIPGAIFFLVLLPLLFPTGTLPGRGWRVLLWVAIFLGIANALFNIVAAEYYFSAPVLVNNPYFIPALSFPTERILYVSSFVVVLPALPAMISFFVRYRRGSQTEKQQLKWILVGLCFAIFAPVLGTIEHPSMPYLLGIVVMIPALAMAIAILHYRLYDIDIIINKSLVYGALTLLLLILFSAISFGATRLFQGYENGNLIAVMLAALLFGMVLQPARYRLQRFVDRRFYNIQIDYQKAHAEIPAHMRPTTKSSLGEYSNLELIGEGGMAQVFKALHPQHAGPVAIKVLPARLAAEQDFTTRFQREAETIALLQHPNIVRIFDYGQEDGVHYMVMEYLNGPDLSSHINSVQAIPLAQAAPLLRNIASALDYAHAQGLVHRDIKPSNVMLHWEREGDAPRAVLTDFGIAKLLDKTAMTNTGGMLGTFDYIAPEQIRNSADIDHRADIYAFGALTFQMLSGALPFPQRNPAAVLIAHLNQPPPDPRERNKDVSLQTAQVIMRAMAKEREERFNSAGEFIAALG